ncbi:IS5 family transposase [Photobacterium sp. TY1-4]|uniref:IS5 family transposase n=1 Tax=Photobacterium sp. TY1-4 TaxID=2899122 RepID=UPI0021C1EA86|nr:IS5 family transposase [Photobacterium sp. TY1-4]UXI00529.1 IS5 family transposase [Photobacterium sp. TY1-4]
MLGRRPRGNQRHSKTVDIPTQVLARGEIRHLAIDATGLKVFGEGEWKMKNHGKEERRVWRKLHLAVDADTHQVICAELSLSTVTDGGVMPTLLNQTYLKIKLISGDGAYYIRLCYQAIQRKKAQPLTLLELEQHTGSAVTSGYVAVANQRIHGSNERWKKACGYHSGLISETAMSRYKRLLGSALSLHDYNAQVEEARLLLSERWQN